MASPHPSSLYKTASAPPPAAPAAIPTGGSSSGGKGNSSLLERATSHFPFLLPRPRSRGRLDHPQDEEEQEEAFVDAAASVASSRSGNEDDMEEDGGRGSSASTAAPSSVSSTTSTPQRRSGAQEEGGTTGGGSERFAPPRTTELTAEQIEALPLADAAGLSRAVQLVEDLAADDRLLQAAGLLVRVRAAVADAGAGGVEAGAAAAWLADPARGEWLARLEARAGEAEAAMADLEDASGWVFDHSLLGVDTFRRYEGGLLHIMVTTLIDREKYDGLTVYEPIAVLKEADYYHRWSPYCTRNAVVRSYDGKGDLLLFLLFNLRVIRREIFLRINIVDDSLDHKRLLILGHSVPRAYAEAEAAAAGTVDSTGTTGTTGPRGLPSQCYEDCPPMHFPSIRALISQPDERHVRVRIAVIIDMNTSIPRAVVDFAIRRFFQVLIHLIVRAAKAAATNPIHNIHAQLIRRDSFYRRFLLPKYLAMCAHYGWRFPGIRALEVDNDQTEPPTTAPTDDGATSALDALLSSAVLCSGQDEDPHLNQCNPSGKKKKRRRLRPRKHARRLVATLRRVVSREQVSVAAAAALGVAGIVDEEAAQAEEEVPPPVAAAPVVPEPPTKEEPLEPAVAAAVAAVPVPNASGGLGLWAVVAPVAVGVAAAAFLVRLR